MTRMSFTAGARIVQDACDYGRVLPQGGVSCQSRPCVESLLSLSSASGLLPATVNVPLQAALDHFRQRNLDSLRTQIDFRFRVLEQQMVRRMDTDSDFFKAVVLKIVREGMETVCHHKRKALANAMGSYVDPRTADWQEKDVLVRILLQLTGIEIQVLEEVSEVNVETAISGEEIATRLSLDADSARVICEGLRQIALIRDPTWDQFENGPGNWALTPTGRRLIAFSSCDREA